MKSFRVILIIFFSFLSPRWLRAQSPDGLFNPNAGGSVLALAVQPDGKILMGGQFTTAGGVARNRIARLNADGTLDGVFNPNADGQVNSIAMQADGKILLGGNFTVVGGVTRNRIARLSADGMLESSFNPNASGTVNSLALQVDGKILIGGQFATVGGVARNRIARLNANGTLDNAFNPNPNGDVNSLALQADGKILIGGQFTTAGGVTRNRIARLNADGTLDGLFNPNADGQVNSIAVQADGKILMGGNFTSVGGVARNRIARLNADGTLDSAFNPNASDSVYSLALQADGQIFLGGSFTSVGGVARNRIGRLNADGTLDSAFNPNVSSGVYSLGLQADGQILIGGGFTSVGAVARNSIARLPNNGAATSTLTVTDIAQIDWTRGGAAPEVEQVAFESWNGSAWVNQGGATRVEGGWRMSGLSLPTTGWIRATARSCGGYGNCSSGLLQKVSYYGGGAPDMVVTTAGSRPLRSGEYTLDFGMGNCYATGSPATITITNTGDALLTGLTLSLDGACSGDFVLGTLGATSLAPGASTSFLVAFSPLNPGIRNASVVVASNDVDESPFEIGLSGSAIHSDTSFNPKAGSTVICLAMQADGKILMGGQFTTIGGVARNRIARLNEDGLLDGSFNPNANGVVYSLAVQANGKILLGGEFSSVGGMARNRIARLNEDGTLDDTFNPNTGGTVNALAVQADGKILLGGNFTSVGGVARNRIARLNADGTVDSAFNPNASGVVNSLAVQADGKILLGGNFTSVGGVARNRIARLNADGTLDSAFNPNASGGVYSLAVQADGKILMGGQFATVGGVARNSIARLNADGTLDGGFDPNASSQVSSMAIQVDGKILIGGQFTMVGGVARNRIARLNADGTLDSLINPNASAEVDALALQVDGKILIGGSFTSVGGVARNFIARLSNNAAATSTLTVTGTGQIDWTRGGSAPEVEQASFETWDGSAWVGRGAATRVAGGWRMTDPTLPKGGWIRATARSSGGYYNGSNGLVQQIASYGSPTAPDIEVVSDGGTLVNGAASVDFGLIQWISSSASKTITITNAGTIPLTGLSLAISGMNPGDFVASDPGTTTLAPGASASFTITFSPQGGGTRRAAISIYSNDLDEFPFVIALGGTCEHQDPSFNPNAIDFVSALAVQADGKILMGGYFTSVGGVARNRIARLNADGTMDKSFNPDANNPVDCLAVQADGKILIGGQFYTVDGVARNGIARLNTDGTLDSSFNPNVNGRVLSLAIQADGKILVGGGFGSVGGVARNYVARLNTDGTLDSAFNPNVYGYNLNSLAIQADGKILLGGNFTVVGGVTRNRIARLNADGSLDGSFNPNANNIVLSLSLQADGKILMGGLFTSVGGVARNYVARLNTDGMLDSAFNPNASGEVSSLALQADGKILMGGNFTAVGGITRNGIARLDADGSLDSAFDPNANSGVYCLAVQADGKILMGGNFTSVGGVARNRIARLPNNNIATSTLIVSGTNQIDWTRGGSAPEVEQASFETWNGSAWISQGAATRVAGGWSMNDLTLPTSGWIRATALSRGGYANGSSGLVQQIASYGSPTAPEIEVACDGGTLVNGDASVDFGMIQWPSSSTPKTITITNPGTSPLTGLSLALSGTKAHGFATSNLSATTLAPGASVSFTVTFTPLGVEFWGARISISSNDPDESPFVIALSGSCEHQTPSFDPDIGGSAYSLAMQPDGKILMGGQFTTVGGVARNCIARLNADGTVDSAFNPNASGVVNSLAVQADGKILMGGNFTTVGGMARNRIARLNADGTVDSAFNPDASGVVNSLALQADGKILMGGNFTTVGGMARNRIARLNGDGTLDSAFNPNADGQVLVLAIQADGIIVVAGEFTSVGGVARNRVARLPNNNAATSTLIVTGTSQIEWMRGGSAPEVELAGFESWDGSAWISLGSASRVSGGWITTGLSLPVGGWIRATAQSGGGYYSGRSGLVRRIASYGEAPSPDIAVEDAVARNLVSGASRLDFGSSETGGNTQRLLTIRNDGAATLNGLAASSDSTDFSVSAPVLASLAPGQTTTCTVTFHPVWPGGFSGSVSIASNDADETPFVVALSGSAHLPPEITLEYPGGTILPSGATSAFGPLLTGQALPRAFTIRNTGAGSLNLGGIAITGANAGDFALTTAGTSPVVQSSGTTTLLIVFQPATPGAKSATLTIPSNDADENPFMVTLTGTGNTAPAFAGYGVSTPWQTDATIPLDDLLANAADADGDALTLIAVAPVSAQGGTAVIQSGSILYTPPAAFYGTDTFTVTIADAHGATASGTVSVSVGDNPNPVGQGANSPQLTILPGGHVGIAFRGIPSASYPIQRSTNLIGWSTIATVAADANGEVNFTDESPPPGSGFYRLIMP